METKESINWSKLLLGFGMSIIIVLLDYFVIRNMFSMLYILDIGGFFAYFLLIVHFLLPFILNFMIFKYFKDGSIKKGILVGYVIIIIYFAYLVYLFVTPILSNYYNQKALSEGNQDLCANVKDLYAKDDCYRDIAFRKNDSSICDQISSKSSNYERYECYIVVAGRLKDPQICEKIQTSDKRDECLNYLGTDSNDLIICDKITSQERKDNCYLWSAMNKKDKSFFEKVCPLIITQEHKDDCYGWYAALTKDFSLCQNIVKEDKRTMCVNGRISYG